MSFAKKINLMSRFLTYPKKFNIPNPIQERFVVIKPAYTDGSPFAIGIPNGQKKWSIVHVPSETIILSLIPTKKDAIKIINCLKSHIEYDSILLITPDFNQIEMEIYEAVQNALLDFKKVEE